MEEIGRQLQAARLAKGVSLQEVESETRIRKKYLEALENGRMALIPGEVYVKGFLRSYANFLGLDGEALVEEYKAAKAALEAEALASEGGATTAPANGGPAERTSRLERPERAVAAPRAASPEERAFRRVPPPASPAQAGAPTTGAAWIRPVALAVAILIPVVGLGWWLVGKLMAQPEPPPPVTAPPVAEKKPAPAPPPPPPPAPTVTMTAPKGDQVAFAVSTSPVEVRMEGFREGFPWMQVWVDGQEVFQGIPSKPVEYKGKQVVMRVGHMNGVDLVINGRRFDAPLKNGPYTITVKGD